MSAPASPAELVAGLVAYLAPGEPLTIPHGLAKALADAVPIVESARPEGGTAPGGDFTPGDLMTRYRRGRSWVFEKLNAGDFGQTYRIGRDRIATRAGVLAFDERLRSGEGDAEPATRETKGKRTAPLSLIERRKAAGSGR